MRLGTFWAVAATAAAMTAGPAQATCTVGKLLELPVTMNGTRPLVPVTLNGHEERMLVDSGAFFNHLSPGVASELGLHLAPVPVGFTIRGIGGSVQPSIATVKTLELAGAPFRNVPFFVGGSEIGGAAAGLIGQNVLGIGDVEYDLAHGAIRLMRPHDCKGVNFAYWAGTRPVSVVTLEARGPGQPHTIGSVIVNGVKLRAVFDTGAAGTVMSLAAAAKLGIRPDSPGVRPDGYGRGLGSKTVASYLIPIDDIKLGDGEEIRRTHLRAEAVDIADWDMLIGADFFRSHRVYVANGLRRLFFTYDGGPIFSTGPMSHVDEEGKAVTIAADDTAAPTDAAGYSRRGAGFMARHDYPAAIADLDRAVAMAPGTAAYVYQRAQARQANRQPLMALADLDRTLTLDPGNADARLARASIRLARRDRAGAEEDAGAVAGAAAPAADVRLRIAHLYAALDRFDAAVGQYDLWLRYHPDDSRKPEALNGRCWVRAEAGVDLGKALADCDGAIRGRPGTAQYLDSRALVRLRMGDAARAIRDYDAALALRPKSAWSLYGRGLAKQHAGDKAGGQQDIDAALAIDPALPERAKTLGVS